VGILIDNAAFDAWQPIRVFWRGAELWVDWCYFGATRYTEPFFRDTVNAALRQPFNLAFRRETPIDALVEWRQVSLGLQPTAFLLHASRCGSTLISQMLAALDTHIVISEPPPLDALLRARYLSPGLDPDAQVEWLRALVSAWAQPRSGETQFVIKLDAWSVFELALVRRAFPDTPWIYLYRDPLEIAVSQMRERGAYMIPGMLGPALYMFDQREVMAMSGEEFIARVLGKMLEAGHAGCVNAGGRALHYDELPQALWTHLREVLGIGDDAATHETLQQAARWDAKTPQLAFAADSERKHREASAQLRAHIERWAGPAYRAMELARAGIRESTTANIRSSQ
jgi:gluconate kinase